MPETRKIKAAINPNFVDKLPINKDKRFHVEGWENGEWTLEEFAQFIKNGWAYCPQLKGSRNKSNFLCSNIVSVDIDSGHTIDATLEDPFVKDHLSLFYTTASHTEQYHRFRLIFLLDKDIEDPQEQVRLNQALAYRLNGDRSATDPTRVFYGNSLSTPEIFLGLLDHKIIEPLVEVGSTPHKDHIFVSEGVSKRSIFRLDPSYVVKSSSGDEISLSEISGKITIHCPFHNDSNPSAFAKRYPFGALFLHCVKCRQTWWEKSDTDQLYQKTLLPDFVSTLKSLDEFFKIHPLVENQEIFNPKLELFLERSKVSFSSDQYFSLPGIFKGITFIRSPKGSGKTSSLPQVMRPLLNRFKSIEDFEIQDNEGPPKSFDSEYRVLLIGHRQALIRELCARLNLNCYLDDELEDAEPFNYRVKRYGVCLDSLWKVGKSKFDLIIIDECEQVLAHFLAKTFDNSRWTFDLLSSMIARSPSVIAMDADLGWTSYLTLCRMRNQHAKDKNPVGQVHIFVNEYIPPRREFELFDSKIHLVKKLENDLNNGMKVFVTSNSKRLIDSLFNAAKDQFSNPNDLICITSDNSKNQDIQKFITNIKREAPKYKGIFCSPSLGTGVDISFDETSDLIDCVYGFFEGGVTTHTEIDQQLARVRNPRSVRCWISKRTFNFETDFEVIESDLLVNHVAGNTSVLIDPVRPEDLYIEKDSFLNMAALIISQQRSSKNRLYDNFCSYKKLSGWDAVRIEKNEIDAAGGSAFIKTGKSITKQQRTTILLNSTTLEKTKFEELSELIEQNEWISREDLASLQRTSLEKFYRQKISAELIDFDDQSMIRSGIIRFEILTKQSELDKIVAKGILLKRKSLQKHLFEDRDLAIVLIAMLLTAAGIYRECQFKPEVEYTTADLAKFIKVCQDYKGYQEGILGISVQKNIAAKPVEHLAKLLKLVGLKQTSDRRRAKGEDRVKLYRIDQDRLDQVNKLVGHRDKYRENPWDFINSEYGFTPDVAKDDEDQLADNPATVFDSRFMSLLNLD